MVQLSILAETAGAQDLGSLIGGLHARACVTGAGRAAADVASRATQRRFGPEFRDAPLDVRASRRVRDYYRAVLRRSAFGTAAGGSRAYRESLRVASAARDLMDAGVRGAALRDELIGTLGMDSGVVDDVLLRMAGVA